jgi:hypothetical protein
MMRPGRIYINTEVRLDANFHDDSGTDTDPDTVTLTTRSPSGAAATYTYLTDDALGRTNTGDFYCDITPNESGRWFWRWTATGNNTTVAQEGNFMVDYSPHFDDTDGAYGSPGGSVQPDTWTESEW